MIGLASSIITPIRRSRGGFCLSEPQEINMLNYSLEKTQKLQKFTHEVKRKIYYFLSFLSIFDGILLFY